MKGKAIAPVGFYNPNETEPWFEAFITDAGEAVACGDSKEEAYANLQAIIDKRED